MIRKAQLEKGEIPPLGALPTVSALKGCFPPHPCKKAMETPVPKEIDKENSGVKQGSDQDPRSPGSVSPSSQSESLYPSLDPFKNAPWAHRSLPQLDPPSNPFWTPSIPPPYGGEAVHRGASPPDKGPQAFPVNLAPEGNSPLEWYPWETKDLKELRKAVTKEIPNSPWALTLLQDIAYHSCVPKDWIDVAKAVLPSRMFIKWTALFKEECRL